MSNQVRLSTLAEVKVLSLATVLFDVSRNDITVDRVRQGLEELANHVVEGGSDLLQSRTGDNIFKTIGLARQVRIDLDYGTQNIYGIGAPTRPRIVPNNVTANVTVERLQLDRRNGEDYFTMLEYWYSHDIQRFIGIHDFLLYSYLFVKSKEDRNSATAPLKYDIFALMPRAKSTPITSGDVMIANNVQLVGFQYGYKEFMFDISNLTLDSVTEFLSESILAGREGGAGRDGVPQLNPN